MQSEKFAEAYDKYSHIHDVLPALGYADSQLADLQSTIERVPCDTVVVATPVDLSRVVRINQATARVTYSFQERGTMRLPTLLAKALENTTSEE